MKSYSQYEQDKILYNIFFKNVVNGIYVDIGAHNGEELSNTLFYEHLGWDGICVEPLEEPYKQLVTNRKCVCINGAISDMDVDFVEFCSIEGYPEMLSGIVTEYTEQHKKRIINECENYKGKRKLVKVKNYKFADIVPYNNINFIDIDTEGNELKIIKSIDYAKYNIQIISAENNYNDPEMKAFLETKDFIFKQVIGSDWVFENKFYTNRLL
jgi:FkbM family methyltransferase